MAYAYQLNIDGDATKGYVKYNVTPDIFQHALMKGDTFTVTGEAKCNLHGVAWLYGYMGFGTHGVGYHIIFNNPIVEVIKNKGTAFTFTMNCVFDGLTNDRGTTSAYLTFMFGDASGETFGTYTDHSANIYTMNYRAAPTANVSFTDTTSAYSVFDKFVTNASHIKITHNAAADPYDPETTIQSVLFHPTGTDWGDGIDITTDNTDIGVLIGEYVQTGNWLITITDNRGMTGSVTGTWDVISYAPPTLASFTAERYSAIVLETGETVYEPDDSSPLVRISFTGTAHSLASQGYANAWTATAKSGAYTHAFLTGEDSDTSIDVEDNRDALNTQLTELSSHDITLTISDLFSSVSLTYTIPKCGGIFNIERTGVAVGTVSSGTAAEPLFECAYPAHFSAGIYDANGTEIGATIYSLTPRICGKWIDGTSVYRVVVPLSKRTSTSGFYLDLPVNVGFLVNIYGAYVQSNGMQNPVNIYGSGQRFYVRLYAANKLYIINDAAYTHGYIILDYIPATTT